MCQSITHPAVPAVVGASLALVGSGSAHADPATTTTTTNAALHHP